MRARSVASSPPALADRQPEEGPAVVARSRHRKSGWAWWLAALTYVAFAGVTIATMQSGLHGDPRTTNPHPGPAPYGPFLGFDRWPTVIAISSVPLTLGLAGTLIFLSVRQGRVHWSVIVAIAGLFTGALDPLANWATFAEFDPRMLHFPLSWHYLNISPLLEPALSFLGGYACYYLLYGIGLLHGHARLIAPRIPASSWLGRHPLVATFGGAFVLAIPMNGVLQLMWMKIGIFVYTEGVGPLIHLGNVQLPLIMIVYDCFIFAMVAVLCVRDAEGDLLVIGCLARRLPGHRGSASAGRQLGIAIPLLLTVVAVPLSVLALLRAAGLAHPAYDRFPYPSVKVYDPYGDLQHAGKPGPFYR